MTFLSGALAAPLARVVADLVERLAGKRLERARLEQEARRAVASLLTELERERLDAARQVLLAELAGESWLQRHWRPLVALTAFFSYWYVIVLLPHLVAFGLMPAPRFGEQGLANLHMLTLIALGGYMGARSAEKIARIFGRGRRGG